MKTDETLVTEYLQGDELALRELIERYAQPIFSFVRRLVGDRALAEDIAQEVFVRAWRQLRSFRTKENFKPWLFAIARNAAIDALRKKRTLVFSDVNVPDDNESDFAETLSDPAPLPDELFANRELGKLLETALISLSPDARAVLLLHYTEGLTFEEIAVALGKPMNTVKSWHRRALLGLRKQLTKP